MGPDPVHGTAQTLPRVWAVADSDSYLKWAASTLDRLPDEWDRRLLVLTGTASPSRSQIDAAVAGTGVSADGPFTPAALAEALRDGVDVLLVATRGATAQALRQLVLGTGEQHRPAVLTGLPGVSVPATQKALDYRCFADGFVVHAVREVEEFSALAVGSPLEGRIVLASLPFAADIGGPPHLAARVSERTSVVFAAQAVVPRSLADRERLVRMLVRAAEAQPATRFVLKVRALGDEVQTHAETHPLPDVLDDLNRRGELATPPNLVVDAGPMAAHLAGARGLATVSSTAAIEALSAGVPVLVLDDFGVSAELVNEVFRGSGLLAGAEALAAVDFRVPDPRWSARHYFHEASENTLEARVLELTADSRAGRLRPLPDVAPRQRAASRRAYARYSAFGTTTGSASDRAWGLWFTLRRVARGVSRRLRGLLSRTTA